MVEIKNNSQIDTSKEKQEVSQNINKTASTGKGINVDKILEKQLKDDKKEEEAIKKMNIYQKISVIQHKIGEIIKNETNSFQKYKFFGELEVFIRLKPLLNQYNLLIMVSDDMSNTEHNKLWHEKDGKEHYVSYPKKAEMVNLDNSTEKLVFNFWATGQNTDISKSKGCGETYSLKYFLTKFFLIPIKDKEDPDYKDSPGDEEEKERQASAYNPEKVVKRERVFTCMKCSSQQVESKMRTVGNQIICSLCLSGVGFKNPDIK